MIKEFKDRKEYKKYLKGITKERTIGNGSEGKCFLGSDYLVYKLYDKEIHYCPEDVITSNDYNFKHFAFPIDLYTDPNHEYLYGYNCKFLYQDILNDYGDIEDINVDNLVKNYYSMLHEVKILSKDNIIMYDLIFNLLYNNRFLFAIDTLLYHQVEYDPFMSNNDILLDAITNPLNLYYGLRVNVNDMNTIDDIANAVKKRVKEKKY